MEDTPRTISAGSRGQKQTRRNRELVRLVQLAKENVITLDHLKAIHSFEITNEHEYHLILFLAHTLTQAMTNYRLAKTPNRILNALNRETDSKDS